MCATRHRIPDPFTARRLRRLPLPCATQAECYDLLSSSKREGNAPVQIDWETHAPSGETCVVLERPADLMEFLSQVIANRTARSTNFNHASSGHSGSSRSHAALILTLMQLDEASREYCQTSFTLVDLAGAERPDKVRDELEAAKAHAKAPKDTAKFKDLFNPEFMPMLIQARDSGAMTQKQINSMMPINMQTRVINFELCRRARSNPKRAEWHRP